MLEVTNIAKEFPTRTGTARVVDDVTFTVGEREFFTIVGPSGAGKTTVLRCLTGLAKPTEGTVRFNGKKVVGPPPEFAVVFQDYARSLMAWFTVRRNVELPLRNLGLSAAERRERVDTALAQVGLSAAGSKYPWQLSGGMQQRVAIARAIAYRPQVLIMDEPFASVDAQTRADLEDLLLRVRDETDLALVFVTHDVDEAVYLSDRVAILSRSPSRIDEIVPIDLPAQRDQIGTKELPEFARLRAHVFSRIRAMVNTAEPQSAH
ncbi:ABC transporter ATP-binding protein [Saccharopolyspora sp. NPDC050642]|uniref:ABC transporter ATP-binding protein n=1 Tax=Saccharopolyspora sp. NPDC050642 TaxID=3157099 RepID=UPI0033C09DBE